MKKIIAVDFDGTLCENAWPKIGKPKQGVIDYVLHQQKQGAKLILWTNRQGDKLDAAVQWCGAMGIEFDAINENLPEIVYAFGGDTRKVYADEYLDDRALTPNMVKVPVMRGTPTRRGRHERGSLHVGRRATENA